MNKEMIKKYRYMNDLLDDLESVTLEMQKSDIEDFNELKNNLIAELNSLVPRDFLSAE